MPTRSACRSTRCAKRYRCSLKRFETHWPSDKAKGFAFFVLPVVLTGACSGAGHTQSSPRPNILLVTIDTFRADRMTPELTPTIARLAVDGLRFTSARTTVPLTLPAHTTIM